MVTTPSTRAGTRRALGSAVLATVLVCALVQPATAQVPSARLASATSANAAAVGASAPLASLTTTGPIMSAHSKTNPRSIWVVVNKKRPLKPKSYRPANLVTVKLAGTSGKLTKPTAAALKRLAKASRAATGRTMVITSAYRSYATQKVVYAKWRSIYGTAKADTLSARPGYSEHQTGLAVDIGESGSGTALSTAFGSTKTGKWVRANAWKYGFIVRYPKGKQRITGYQYEPWHLRYVGVELATSMHKRGITTLERALRTGNAARY